MKGQTQKGVRLSHPTQTTSDGVFRARWIDTVPAGSDEAQSLQRADWRGEGSGEERREEGRRRERSKEGRGEESPTIM